MSGLIPVILFMFLNASINKHYHKLPNGEIIVHAHFYNNSNSQDATSSHSHTKNELNFFNLFGNPILLIILFFLGIGNLLFQKDQLFFLIEKNIRKLSLQIKLNNKAPPVYKKEANKF